MITFSWRCDTISSGYSLCILFYFLAIRRRIRKLIRIYSKEAENPIYKDHKNVSIMLSPLMLHLNMQYNLKSMSNCSLHIFVHLCTCIVWVFFTDNRKKFEFKRTIIIYSCISHFKCPALNSTRSISVTIMIYVKFEFR